MAATFIRDDLVENSKKELENEWNGGTIDLNSFATLTETKRIRKEGFEKKGAWFVTSNVEGRGWRPRWAEVGGKGRRKVEKKLQRNKLCKILSFVGIWNRVPCSSRHTRRKNLLCDPVNRDLYKKKKEKKNKFDSIPPVWYWQIELSTGNGNGERSVVYHVAGTTTSFEVFYLLTTSCVSCALSCKLYLKKILFRVYFDNKKEKNRIE